MFRLRFSMSSRSLLAEHEEQSVGLLPNMEARAEHQKTKQYQALYTFTTSVGVGLLILVLFWILHFRKGFAWQSTPGLEFNWHPFLMTMGMIFFYSQAMLTYRTGRNYQKQSLKLVHASMNGFAFILSVIGLKAVFDSHNLAEKPINNLYSLHSWLGLITVIIFSAQFLGGFVSFLYPGLSQSMRKAILPVHVAIGTSCFIGAVISAVTGILEKTMFVVENYSELPSEGIVVNLIGLFLAFYGILVVYLVNDMDYKRNPLADDQIVLERSE